MKYHKERQIDITQIFNWPTHNILIIAFVILINFVTIWLSLINMLSIGSYIPLMILILWQFGLSLVFNNVKCMLSRDSWLLFEEENNFVGERRWPLPLDSEWISLVDTTDARSSYQATWLMELSFHNLSGPSCHAFTYLATS